MKYNHDSMLPIGAFKPRGSVVGGRSMRLHSGDSGYFDQAASDAADLRHAQWMASRGDTSVLDRITAAAPAPAPAPVYNEPAPAPAYNPPAPAAPAPAPAPAATNWTQTINDIYQQEFGRQADPSGLASFTNLLNQGLTGEQMREALRTSAEGQSRGLSPAPQGIASLPASTPAAYTPFDLKQYGYNTDLETQYYNAAKLANWQMSQGRPDVAQQYIQQANELKKQLDSPYRIDTFTPYGGGDSGGGVPETVLVDRSGNIVSSITAQDDGKYAVVSPGTGDAGASTTGGSFTLDDIIKQSQTTTAFGVGRGQAIGQPYELKNADGEPYQRYDANGNLTEFVNRLTGEWTKASDVKPIGTVFDPTQGKMVTQYQYGDNKFISTPGSGGSTFAPIMDPYSKDTGGFMGEGGWAKIGALVAVGLSAGIAGGAFAGIGLGVAPGTMTAAQAAAALGGTQAATLGAIGTAAAQSALANIAISGFQGATPSQMLKAGLIGAVSGGAGSAIGTAGLGTVGNIAAKVGLQTGITAATGGNVQNALISGIISSTLPLILNEALPADTFKSLNELPKPVQTLVMSTASSVLGAGVSGGNISDAAVSGVTNGLISLGKDFASGAFKDLSESELGQTVKNYLNPSYEEFQALPEDANATLDDVIRNLPKTPTTGTTASAKDPYSVENIMANIEAGYQKDIKPIEGSETAGLGSFIADKVKQYFNLSDPQTQEEVNDFFKSVLKQVGESPQVQSAAGNLDVLGNIPAGISGLFSYGIMRPEGADVAQQFKEADFEKYGSPVAKLFNIPMDESSAYAQSSGQQIMQAIGSGIKWLGGVAEEKLGIPSTDVETLVEAFGPKVVGKTLSTAANLKGPALESFKDNLSKWSADYQNAREGIINLDPNLGSVSGEFINKVVGQKETPIIKRDVAEVIPETKPESAPTSLLEYSPERPVTSPRDVSAFFDEIFESIEKTPTYDVPPLAKTEPTTQPSTQTATQTATKAEPLPTKTAEPVINLGPEIDAGVISKLESQAKAIDQETRSFYEPQAQAKRAEFVSNTYETVAKEKISDLAAKFFDDIYFGGATSTDVAKAIQSTVNNPSATPDEIIREVNGITSTLPEEFQNEAKIALLDISAELGISPEKVLQNEKYNEELIKMILGEVTSPEVKPGSNTEDKVDYKPPVPPKPPAPPSSITPPNPPVPPKPPVPPSDVVPPIDIVPPSSDISEIEDIINPPVIDPNTGKPKVPAVKVPKLVAPKQVLRSGMMGVAAKTPPGAEIDYLYDIGGESIFAPMRAKSKYEPREGYYDPKVERRYADGGFVDEYTVDDLYELLRSK